MKNWANFVGCIHYFFYINSVASSSKDNMPNPALGLLKSTDNINKTSTKDWNLYLANSHNLTALNATGNLKDCSATNMIGPCWDSPYGSVRP